MIAGSLAAAQAGGQGAIELPVKSMNRHVNVALRVAIPKTTRPPKVDGRLDDAVWKEAARITGFTEVEPNAGATPKDSTVGLVAYDRDNMYIAVIAYGPSGSIISPMTQRDAGWIGGGWGDGITLRLDTFNDARSAYVLQASPRGVQGDHLFREGDFSGYYEDFIWRSSARIEPDRYIIEFQIPFSSLRFPGDERFDIGFNIIRDYHGFGRQDSWAPRVRGNACDICQEGVLLGFQNVSTRKVLDVRPYVVAANAGARKYGVGSVDDNGTSWPVIVPGTWETNERSRQIGADFGLALTPAIILNATINPDFSQIEASPEQIRVNRRFALYYPDRRPFFTTGSDAFSAGNGHGDVFYTRNVVDPSVGARLTNKRASTLITGLYARDLHPAYYHYDGYESSFTDETPQGPADVAVLRVRRDVGQDSYIGLMLADREHLDASNRVAAADVRFRFKKLTLTADGGWSDDHLPSLMQTPGEDGSCAYGYTLEESGSCQSDLYNGDAKQGHFLRSGITLRTASMSLNANMTQVSPTFRAQLGNFDRAAVEKYDGSLMFDFRPHTTFGLRGINAGIYGGMTNSYHGGNLDFNFAPSLYFRVFTNGNVGFSQRFERSTFLGRPLDTHGQNYSLSVPAGRLADLTVSYNKGDQPIYDFTNPRTGTSRGWNVAGYLYPMPSMIITPMYSRTKVSEPGGGPAVVDAELLYLTTEYQHTPALGFRGTINLSDQSSTLLENPFSRESAYAQSSFILKYEIAPTSFAYFGVLDERQRFVAPVVPKTRFMKTGGRVFFKLSYLVRM
jgi:hypothetical protein